MREYKGFCLKDVKLLEENDKQGNIKVTGKITILVKWGNKFIEKQFGSGVEITRQELKEYSCLTLKTIGLSLKRAAIRTFGHPNVSLFKSPQYKNYVFSFAGNNTWKFEPA